MFYQKTYHTLKSTKYYNSRKLKKKVKWYLTLLSGQWALGDFRVAFEFVFFLFVIFKFDPELLSNNQN